MRDLVFVRNDDEIRREINFPANLTLMLSVLFRTAIHVKIKG